MIYPRAGASGQSTAAEHQASPPGFRGLVLIGQFDILHAERLGDVVKCLVAELVVAQVGQLAKIRDCVDVVHHLDVNLV